jgi:hypothetical protein
LKILHYNKIKKLKITEIIIKKNKLAIKYIFILYISIN